MNIREPWGRTKAGLRTEAGLIHLFTHSFIQQYYGPLSLSQSPLWAQDMRQHTKEPLSPLSLPSWKWEETAINQIITQINGKLQILVNTRKKASRELCALTMGMKAVKNDFQGWDT